MKMVGVQTEMKHSKALSSATPKVSTCKGHRAGESQFAGRPTGAGAGVIAFNCSNCFWTSCQSSFSFFVFDRSSDVGIELQNVVSQGSGSQIKFPA